MAEETAIERHIRLQQERAAKEAARDALAAKVAQLETDVATLKAKVP